MCATPVIQRLCKLRWPPSPAALLHARAAIENDRRVLSAPVRISAVRGQYVARFPLWPTSPRRQPEMLPAAFPHRSVAIRETEGSSLRCGASSSCRFDTQRRRVKQKLRHMSVACDKLMIIQPMHTQEEQDREE